MAPSVTRMNEEVLESQERWKSRKGFCYSFCFLLVLFLFDLFFNIYLRAVVGERGRYGRTGR